MTDTIDTLSPIKKRDEAQVNLDRLLTVAAKKGDVDKAADLLSAGADVNAQYYNKSLFYDSQVRKASRGGFRVGNFCYSTELLKFLLC